MRARAQAAAIAIAASALIAVPSFAIAHSRPTVRLLPAGRAPRTTAQSHGSYRMRVRNPGIYRAQKAAAARAYRRHSRRRHVRASAATGAQPTILISSSLNQPGLDASASGGATPPDTTGAIGPANYVELVNSEIAVYSRDSLTSPVSQLGEQTFVGSPDPTCDGQIQWDQQWQRWLYSALDCSASANTNSEALFFGWSKTSDPSDLSSSNWCRYAISTGNEIEDFPKLGHDDGQIIIGTNGYDDTTQNYTTSNIFVADKPASPASCPSTESATETAVSPNDFTPVPANIADSSQDGYVVTTNIDNAHLDLYTIAPDGSVASPTSVTVPTFYLPANVPQPGTSDVIDSSDTRLTQAVAVTDPGTGQEGIWTQHAIATAGASGVSVVRWYELTPGATTPRQIGTISGPSGTFAWGGAISPTEDGTGAMVFYNSGDAGHLVDLRVQDRNGSTPLGETTDDLQLAQSPYADLDFSCASPYGPPCRWGDYAGASPDPTNPALVWGTGELTALAPPGNGAAQWGSQNVAVSTIPPPLVTGPGATSIGLTSATLTGTVNPEGNDTSYHFVYGATPTYGSSTQTLDAGSATADQAVSAVLTGLSSGVTYHYALIATNAYGTTATPDLTFTTASPSPPSARITFPTSGGQYTVGQVVRTAFSCSEGSYGPGLRSCVDSSGSSGSAGHLDTRTVGTHVYYVTATSVDGRSSSSKLLYAVRPKPVIAIRSAGVAVSHRSAGVKVACSGGVAASVCRGQLSLTSHVTQRVRRRTGGRLRTVTATRTVTLATRGYAVPTGKQASVALALSRTALTLLARAPQHRLSAFATATLPSGSGATRTITLTR